MPDSTTARTDLDVINDDIATLKRDVAALVEHVRSGAVSRAAGAAAQLREEAQDIYGRLAPVEIRRADRGPDPVDRHGFGVQDDVARLEDLHPGFEQVGVVRAT